VFETPDRMTKNWKRSPAPTRMRETNPRMGPVSGVSFGRNCDGKWLDARATAIVLVCVGGRRYVFD
jgi:hypothetical protein